ncbi:MAG TPA: hypothetical protein VHE35_13980, partial [Kofleriaceae bacterium]|nr:hypothetical protein [Kofleriaceae bacterium]
MLTAHLQRLGLICPACRLGGRGAARLEVRLVLHSESTRAGVDLLEGLLACPTCRRDHPILDGVVVAVADLRRWAEHQLDAAVRRHDLSPLLERVLAAAAPPSSAFAVERRTLSAVAGAQWSDREVGAVLAPPGSFAQRCLRLLASLPSPPRGLWLDA